VDVTNGRSLTFGEFRSDVEMAARHLMRLGCRRGDVIALFAPNSFQWMTLAAAALRIGAVFAAINNLLKPGIDFWQRILRLLKMFIFPYLHFSKGRHFRRHFYLRLLQSVYNQWNQIKSFFDRTTDSKLISQLESTHSLQVLPPRQCYSPGGATIFALPAVPLLCPL